MIGCHSKASHGPPDGLAKAVRAMELTFPCALDAREKTVKRFGAPSRPYLVLVGTDGTVDWRGHPWDDDLEVQIELALADVPEPVTVTTDGLPDAVRPHAEAAATGDYAAAIKGLVAVIEDNDTDEETAEAAGVVMEQIAEIAARGWERIEELEAAERFVEADAAIAKFAWLRTVDYYREQLDDLLADRDEETVAAARRAGEIYHQALARLRAGEPGKARALLREVAYDHGATTYGELAANMLTAMDK